MIFWLWDLAVDDDVAEESFFMVQVGNKQPQRMKIHTETLQVPFYSVFLFNISFDVIFSTMQGKGTGLPSSVSVFCVLQNGPRSTHSIACRHNRYVYPWSSCFVAQE